MKLNLTPEQQLSSLEISKRLRELGINEASLFQYCFHAITGGPDYVHLTYEGHGLTSCGNQYLKISAYTVAELGEMLPKGINSYKDNLFPWTCERMHDGYRSCSGGHTEAEARAKMLIHLIEQGIVEVKGL